MENSVKFKSVDQYIRQFPDSTQKMLREMQRIISGVAKNAEEVISYNMPAYKQHKVLVYFAAYKNHIGFYPGGNGVKEFASVLTDYKTSKGAIQFPINNPLPVGLIQKIVRFRKELDTLEFEKKKKTQLKPAKKNFQLKNN